MDYLNNTINTLPRERGQHLRFEDRCEIKALHKQGYSYRQIAKALNCSPSTVGYELKRGTASTGCRHLASSRMRCAHAIILRKSCASTARRRPIWNFCSRSDEIGRAHV